GPARGAYRARGRPVRARRARRSGVARAGRLGRLHAAAAAVAGAAGTGSGRRTGALTIEEAYAEVERVTRRRARNFAYGIMVLPRPKRRAVAAIYAFAREVDDVADGDAPAADKRRRLETLHVRLDEPPPDEAI